MSELLQGRLHWSGSEVSALTRSIRQRGFLDHGSLAEAAEDRPGYFRPLKGAVPPGRPGPDAQFRRLIEQERRP
jgi:hypothetical protein